ncbi:MAG: RidA family protein [Pseudomonadota bacterium]|nr:RidA family protein [Pseudomonadota bacterium]
MPRHVINVGNPEGLPLSEAVRFGDLVFVSGMVGSDAAGAIVEGGIAAETRQVFRNIEAVLAQAGCSLGEVIKVNVVLTNANDFDAFNAAYRTIFPSDPPARVSMVAGLTIEACIEVDVIAGCGNKPGEVKS